MAEVQESNGYNDGDLHSIPSLIVRKALKICSANGRGFFTADSSLLGLRYKNYENINDQQEVTLIDKSSFMKFLLEKNCYQSGWLKTLGVQFPKARIKRRRHIGRIQPNGWSLMAVSMQSSFIMIIVANTKSKGDQ